MAAVYKAYDPNLRRTVAVKIIHSHLSNNPDFLRRFEEEATSIARLRHPNIIQIFDFNHEGNNYYMVMEFIAGETLQTRLKRLKESNRRLPFDEAIGFASDISQAAAEAHQRGMIHRDIKPANVMINVHNRAVLMDFGIARMVGGSRHTATGAVLGTAMYMSPEQIQGIQADTRADIYSIGVTLFEMLGGRPPFESDSAMTLMMMHLNDPVPDIRKLSPDVPLAMLAVIDKALAKNRDQRYQSAGELNTAIRKCLDSVDKPLPPAAAAMATIIEPLNKAQPGSDRTIMEPLAPDSVGGKDVNAVTVQKTSSGQTIIERTGHPVSAGRPAAPMAAPVAAPVAAPQAVPTPVTDDGKPKSSRLGLYILALIALVVLCGGGFFGFQRFVYPELTREGGVLAGLFSNTPATPVVLVVTSTGDAAQVQDATPTEIEATPTQAEATQTLSPTDTVEAPTSTPLPVVIGGADKIAYVNESNIWIANLDGSQLTQLTSDGAEKKYLRWLPDGLGLSYISGKCIKTLSIEGEDQVLTCFPNVDYLDSFEVSPDGSQVVISLDNLIYMVPFDTQALAEADRHSDLERMATCTALAPFERNAGRSVRWSNDGTKWAMIVIGVLKDGRRGDLIHVFPIDRCIPNPLVEVQFPPPHFSYREYERNPRIVSFDWDGDALFSFNSENRNDGFGSMQIFNMESFRHSENINPIDGVCCYRDMQWSPDGSYLVFAFQNYLQGANSTTQIYYIPYGSIGTGASYEPLPLPIITNPREKPQPVLRPAIQP